ncbi:MAG TPA: sigma factor, partial [Planctomycetota bacterium]|nr:sigma factor [Planctomycetota bacterium]
MVVPEAFDFAAAVSEFETPLLRYVRQFFGNDAESAEEVVQEAFLRLHRQVEQHGAASIENMPSWLFRVA